MDVMLVNNRTFYHQ